MGGVELNFATILSVFNLFQKYIAMSVADLGNLKLNYSD